MTSKAPAFGRNCVGKIRFVYCKNFVTYDECEFYPTEYLNVIIGPNGTGKSTLVSAIVLCLGGEPITLYRATDIKDYIKNGKEEAQIAVEVCADTEGKVIKFTRSFKLNNKSQYMIDSETVTRKKYMEIIAHYKIQVTNLCQFLPQDRVQDFAKMNPQEILANTISSVCSEETQRQFNKLKELQQTKQNSHKLLAADKEKCRQCRQRIEELQRTLDAFNTRKDYQAKVKVCTAKRLWLEFEQLDVKLKECENDLKSAQDRLKLYAEAYNKMVHEESIIKRINQNLQDDIKERDLSLSQCTEKLQSATQQIDACKQSIQNAETNFEKQKRDMEEAKTYLENEKKLLELVVQDIKNAREKMQQEKTDEKLQEVELKLEEIKSKTNQLLTRRTNINKRLEEDFQPHIQMHKRRLERLENVQEHKLQFLREKFSDVYTAVNWLRANESMFEGHVYKPMIIELNVSDPSYAKYFENTIQIRDLLSFICENKNDMSKLIQELCVNQKLSINVGYSPPAEFCSYQPNIPIQEIREFGFNAYLIDLIDGPAALLNYLCSLYGLHRIPVGSDRVNQYTDVIPTNIRQYFGGDQRYSVTVSKYSGASSVMQTYISPRNLLQSLDVNEIKSIKRELHGLLTKTDALKNERTGFEAKISECEYEYKELKKQKQVLDASKQRLNQLIEQCKRQKLKFAQLSSQNKSLADIELQFTTKSQENVGKLISLQQKMLLLLKAYQKALAEKQLAKTCLQVYIQQNADRVERITEAKETMQQSQQLVNSIKSAIETNTRKHSQKMAEALELTNQRQPKDRRFPFHKEFQQLPNDINELKEVLNEYAARLDCMTDVNSNIVQEYDSKKVEAEMLEAKISDFEQQQQRCVAELIELYNQWLPTIEQIIETLRKHFNDFMESMNYVGDIVLDMKEEHDFESYGIKILVQYRSNEQLQALDRTRQSGGERAVAIAIYSLSLQHISHVPFRCVDEINQGMDATNERKIFDMLVEETTKIGGAQYFFVTPKLVSNPSSNSKMAVHIIYNGFVVQTSTFPYAKLINEDDDNGYEDEEEDDD